MVDFVNESFVFYSSFWGAIKCLPRENQLCAYQYIVEYALQWIIPNQDEDSIAYAIFLMAKPQIDANSDRRKNWCKWWAKPWNQNARKNWDAVENCEIDVKQPMVDLKNDWVVLENDWKQPNVNVNVNANVNVNESKLKISSNEEMKHSSSITTDINNLINELKQECDSLWIAYDKTKERQFAKHILSAKEYGGFCEKVGMSRVLFAINILKASVVINFWKWACSWPMKIYQNYSEVYNRTKELHTKNQKNLIQSF